MLDRWHCWQVALVASLACQRSPGSLHRVLNLNELTPVARSACQGTARSIHGLLRLDESVLPVGFLCSPPLTAYCTALQEPCFDHLLSLLEVASPHDAALAAATLAVAAGFGADRVQVGPCWNCVGAQESCMKAQQLLLPCLGQVAHAGPVFDSFSTAQAPDLLGAGSACLASLSLVSQRSMCRSGAALLWSCRVAVQLPSHPSCFLMRLLCDVPAWWLHAATQLLCLSLLCRWWRPCCVYAAALTAGRGSCGSTDLPVFRSAHCTPLLCRWSWPWWVHSQPNPLACISPLPGMRQPCSQGLNSCPTLLTASSCSVAGHSPGAQHHRRVPRRGGGRAGSRLHASALPASTGEGGPGGRSQAPVSHGPGRRPEAAAGESAGGPRARVGHTR